MQRRTSTSQLFQRMRKVSDPVIHAAQALVSGVNNKTTPDQSFFDYGGQRHWHRPHRRPPDSGLRRGLSHRKVSKEDIKYPLLHPEEDTLDLWVESATMSAERDREQRLHRQNSNATVIQPERPPRPSLDERPPVVRDPQLRMEEQRVYRSVNTSKRPERPREQDLPYGAAGSIPRVLVKEERPPPPAAAVRGESSRTQSMARSSTVPFPSSHTHGEDGPRASRATGATRTTEKSAMRPHEPPPASAKIYTPFAPISTRDRPQHNAPSNRPVDSHTRGPSHLAQASTSSQRVLDREYVPTPPPKDSKWLGPSAHAQVWSAVPSHVRRQDGVRRISSSGDVHLPPQHARYQSRDENDPRRRAQELRTVKSTPLSARKQNVPVHPGAAPGLPAHPAVHLERAGTRSKPRNPDVPRDVSPENPQGLPMPRRSREEERFLSHRHREREREKEAAMRAPPVPTRAQAKEASSASRAAPLAHDHIRSVSYRAQVIHPAQRPEPEAENDRQKRRREKEKTGRTVEWYGMSDPVAWEIARALAEPEGVTPLPIDWNQFVAHGKDYGTKPLETRKKERGREAERYRG
ncbi:hypothetical protein C8T65DRAFT_741410 [Cerioporus squamosus]|nr:hypothetical protein C8T65DRAFT_741410 [Cerioporus squamosus]